MDNHPITKCNENSLLALHRGGVYCAPIFSPVGLLLDLQVFTISRNPEKFGTIHTLHHEGRGEGASQKCLCLIIGEGEMIDDTANKPF